MDNVQPNWVKNICYGYVFVLGTTLMPFTISGINYLLLAYSAIVIGLLLLLAAKMVRILVDGVLFLLIVSIACSVFANIGSASLSSILYTVFFISGFSLLGGTTALFLNSGILTKFINWLVVAYATTMFIQQFGGLTGMPIVNINPEFTSEYVEALTFFRYNALSSEPSYGSSIITMLFYLHFLLNGWSLKKHYWFYILVVYLLISFQSGTGTILFFSVVVLKFLQKSKLWLVLGILTVLLLVTFLDNTRIGNLVSAFDVTDPEGSLLQADLSASFRFVPNFLYVKQLNLLDWQFWLGHGYGFSAKTVGDFMPGIELEDKFAGGLLPSMLYDYGFIAGLLFALFSFRICATGSKWIFAVFFLAVSLNANLNTQLVWCTLTFFYWTKYCIDHAKLNSLEGVNQLA